MKIRWVEDSLGIIFYILTLTGVGYYAVTVNQFTVTYEYLLTTYPLWYLALVSGIGITYTTIVVINNIRRYLKNSYPLPSPVSTTAAPSFLFSVFGVGIAVTVIELELVTNLMLVLVIMSGGLLLMYQTSRYVTLSWNKLDSRRRQRRFYR